MGENLLKVSAHPSLPQRWDQSRAPRTPLHGAMSRLVSLHQPPPIPHHAPRKTTLAGATSPGVPMEEFFAFVACLLVGTVFFGGLIALAVVALRMVG